jgi:hypothetical protein
METPETIENFDQQYPELKDSTVGALEVLYKRAKKLYKTAKPKDQVKILELIENLEYKIRGEKYKEQLLKGEV